MVELALGVYAEYSDRCHFVFVARKFVVDAIFAFKAVNTTRTFERSERNLRGECRKASTHWQPRRLVSQGTRWKRPINRHQIRTILHRIENLLGACLSRKGGLRSLKLKRLKTVTSGAFFPFRAPMLQMIANTERSILADCPLCLTQLRLTDRTRKKESISFLFGSYHFLEVARTKYTNNRQLFRYQLLLLGPGV